MTLRLRRRGSRFFSMTEGRKSQIILLDERRLDIIIQPKLHSYELLDLVASHFKLREKHYFGLGFLDDTNHFSWLQADKRVLEHDFPKKTGLLVIYFSIRFYVETIGLLRDIQTVELFYLNGRQVLFKGPEECDSETVFELAAHVLQATNGDFVSEEETREELKKLPLILTSALKEHPSITYCEDRVICQYEKLVGTSRGLAIVNYMTIIENLPTYGIHFYEVKDKKDIPWWLGISPKGIAVYDKVDRKTPRKLFTWKHLENLYYRDRKFSIEVSSPKRDESGNQMSVSRRTFGASNVDVHAWFAATSQLTKGIWSMAVAQHQFYLDRKQSKSQLPTARSMSEIAADLCRSTASLPGSMGSDLSRSPSSHSLPSLSNSRYDLTIEQSDSLKAEREMVKALRARKEALEEALAKRTEELKQLCFEEGQLTGVLPHDTPPMAPGETVPTFRRRVGTAFSLSVKDKGIDSESSDLSNLELEVDLQGKITSAAHRLASDKTVSKYVRKQRKQSYIKSATKLKEMEKKLGDMRRQIGKFSGPEDHHHPHHHPSSTSSSTSSSSHQQRCKEGFRKSDGFSIICQASVTPTPSEASEDQNQRTALSPSHSSPQLSNGPGGGGQEGGHPIASRGGGDHHQQQHQQGIVPSAQTGGVSPALSSSSSPFSHNKKSNDHHHHQHLDGLEAKTKRLHLLESVSPYRLDGSQDSGFSSANNMYNVNSQRTSHYESKDHLLQSPANSEPGFISPLKSQFRHDDVARSERMYGQERELAIYPVKGGASTMHYGSLDRQKKTNYANKDAYRDLSPMRYNDSTSRGSGGNHYHHHPHPHHHHHHTGGDGVHPSNIILEVPVQHETSSRTSSSPSPSFQGGSRSADVDQMRPPGHGGQDPARDALYASNCYSPRFQEGSGLYKDMDTTHIHRNLGHNLSEEQQSQMLRHISSQPMFHRTDRSISPQQHSTIPSSLSSSHFSQYNHHPHNNTTNSNIPSSHLQHQHQSLVPSSSDSLPRSIPIQHIDSSRQTPPPSSPTSLYPPSQTSPSSGSSSPRGSTTSAHASHAPSSLVTVTNLQPHLEVTKPYEISDFYRYSEKLRRQRIIDQYQRQLIGSTAAVEKLSRCSTPQSVDSDGHSSTSHSSTSSHPITANHPLPHTLNTSSTSSANYHSGNPGGSSRGAILQYGRSSSAPLSSSLGQRHQRQKPPTSPIYHQPGMMMRAGEGLSDDPVVSSSSSSSSYSVKTKGPGGANTQHQYAFQQTSSSTSSSSSYRIHTATKHSVYQSPQPMTCKPVLTAPLQQQQPPPPAAAPPVAAVPPTSRPNPNLHHDNTGGSGSDNQ